MRGLAPLEALAASLAKLPGVGRRSAERMAMALVRDPEGLSAELLRALTEARATVCGCARCGSVTTRERNPCVLCASPQRDGTLVCVVEDPADILVIEKSGAFHGRYHALMGRLSPAKGVGPEKLRVQALIERIKQEGFREVILALSTDVEGDATSSYLAELLKAQQIPVNRLAFGLPAGSGIAYADSVTLSRAIQGRHPA
ncbi:MAG: recombination mediator RecR [Verrucomicrobia bacterium]|nr:recombination mediator RecR [Verrucomicrobiota bacterium]